MMLHMLMHMLHHNSLSTIVWLMASNKNDFNGIFSVHDVCMPLTKDWAQWTSSQHITSTSDTDSSSLPPCEQIRSFSGKLIEFFFDCNL